MSTSFHPWLVLTTQLTAPQPALDCKHDPQELAMFVSDELSGCQVDRIYPELAAHLDLCESCLQEYIELSQLAAKALYFQDEL